MTLSLASYVDVANTLCELSILDVSDNRHGFNANKRDDVLKQLRGQFETGRKLFTFSIANASKKFTNLINSVSKIQIYSSPRDGRRR